MSRIKIVDTNMRLDPKVFECQECQGEVLVDCDPRTPVDVLLLRCAQCQGEYQITLTELPGTRFVYYAKFLRPAAAPWEHYVYDVVEDYTQVDLAYARRELAHAGVLSDVVAIKRHCRRAELALGRIAAVSQTVVI